MKLKHIIILILSIVIIALALTILIKSGCRLEHAKVIKALGGTFRKGAI